MERLAASANEQLLHDIPIRFLIDLPLEKSAAFRPLLVLYLKRRGERLFSGYHNNLRVNLEGLETLLNRFFTVPRIPTDHTRSGAIKGYLEPIEAILDGITTEALTYDRDDKTAVSLTYAILDALHLPIKASVYAAVCDNAEIWQDIKKETSEVLFQKKKMQECFHTFINFAFTDSRIRNYCGALEEKIWAENDECLGQNSHNSLSLSLLSAFGESVHHHDILVASKKPETQRLVSHVT